MNYKNLKTSIKNKISKKLTAFIVLSLTILTIFFTKISTSQTLPDCSAVVGTVKPGENCLFFGLKLCQNIPGAGYAIPASSIFSGNALHRENCADLSDMPLCNQMDSSASPVRNCVMECSDPSFNSLVGVRGEDFAVHNRDCIRFCDSPEAGITVIQGVNCASRKCHQLPLTNPVTDPNPPTNCELSNCNLLTPDELNEVKFDDSSKKYCQGTGLKCYQFTAAQLPYVKMRATNTMCEAHNCRTPSETCVAYADDDVQRILNKGASYVNTYKTYINAGYDIMTKTICTNITCRPVINRQFRCLPFSDLSPTTLNSGCDALDTAGNPATCVSGYCVKRLDCNLPINNLEPECTASSVGTNTGTTDDSTVKSWFYRPKPSAASVNGDGTLLTMDAQLCYNQNQMEDHGWGEDIPLLGWFHIDARTPGKCGTTEVGGRGMSYIYLCGNGGLLYNLPSRNTAFHKGYVRTEYTDGDATHKLNVCVRYNNFMDPQNSCGSRECFIWCGFDTCTQHCGYDECRELIITDSQAKDCDAANTFNGNPSKSCLATIDSTIRVRAVKYNDYICTFLDFKGTFAYNTQYMNGTEKMADGTCFSGMNVDGNCVGAKNTNDEAASASVWRTLFQIPYVENNRPSNTPNEARGYLDFSGRLFKEHECLKVPYRIHIPRTYNIANLANSPNLFTPPLYILNARIKRGSSVSVGSDTSPFGYTDFSYPEIEIRFGTVTQKLSLGINYNGYEQTGKDPLGNSTITTNVNGFIYTAEVFVRKEEFSDPTLPQFCLYRKIRDSNGAYIDPQRLGCVKRNLPEISNSTTTPENDLRKTIVYPLSNNTFADSSLVMRYLKSTSLTANSCSGGVTECTSELTLSNPVQNIPNCQSDLEGHQICVQRDECSKLNIECMTNEIDMYAAINANQPISSFLIIRENCNSVLLPLCNSKKGIQTPAEGTVLTSDPNNSLGIANAYGWFNETCIVTGFETKLKDVIAYDLNDNLKGKCAIDPTSHYLIDSNPSTNCDKGGKAPNCLCIQAVEGIDPGAGYEVRKQTPHEAGLCIEMPLPETCPAIDYNTSPNSDINDPEYIGTSLNFNTYGTSVSDIVNKVHISHQYRTSGKAAPNAIPLKGHAEFPISVIGTTDVNGECKGFWTYPRTASGALTKPRLTCVNNNGSASWEDNARNACVRYECPQIFSAGPDQNGFYQGNYGLLENGETKGQSHGFALWPSYQKTNDFTETVNATSCITGFKRVGALATTSSGTVSGANAVTASLYDLITNYNGGTLPNRQCNQLGLWLTPTNICQRITCPAVNPPTPSNSSDSAAWELWRNSGGATFPTVNASRSNSRIQLESIVQGTCNTELGFFTNPGGQAPKRECDHLGNWKTVTNPCVTTCNPITLDADARNFNNGFATWNTTTGGFSLSGLPGVFTSCVSGYVKNPYPSRYDINGALLPDANNLNRTASDPMRLCKTGTTSSGFSASVWGATINGCINQCPGATEDNRIGAGITSHQTSSGNINISWDATPLGQDAYKSNWANPETFNASFFSPQNRSNGNYLLRRHCGTDGKWSDPEVMCSANNGQIGNANYLLPSPTPVGFANSIVAGTGTVTGSCVSSNYWKSNLDTGALPKMACLFDSGANSGKIDKVYLALTDGTLDCEERRCPALTATKTTRASFPTVAANDDRTMQGGQVIGTCINNATNSTGTMMYTSLEAGKSAPHLTCQTGGVWSTIANSGDVNCKKGCDVPAWGWERVDVNGCGGGSDNHIYTYAHTLQHGQILTYYGHDNCGGWSHIWYRGEYCNDGIFSANNYNYGDFPGGTSCQGSYVATTNSFTGPQICLATSRKTVTRLQSTYIDKTNVTGNTSGIIINDAW
jgi:hypothetical protein